MFESLCVCVIKPPNHPPTTTLREVQKLFIIQHDSEEKHPIVNRAKLKYIRT